jgi:hypothetical protein
MDSQHRMVLSVTEWQPDNLRVCVIPAAFGNRLYALIKHMTTIVLGLSAMAGSSNFQQKQDHRISNSKAVWNIQCL